MTSNDTPARALAVLAPTMSPANQVAELMRLATKMMRDSWATGSDASWQPAYQALESALAAALATTPAVPGDSRPVRWLVHGRNEVISMETPCWMEKPSDDDLAAFSAFIRDECIATPLFASPHEGAAADARDAARYRWLRANQSAIEMMPVVSAMFAFPDGVAVGFGNKLDEAIDTAMSAAPASGEKA